MRIGILTLPHNNNYGGYLQSYALMTVLKQLGHQPELIYRRHNGPTSEDRWIYFKDSIRLLLFSHTIRNPFFLHNQQEDYHRKHGGTLIKFADTYIQPRTKPLWSSSELYRAIKKGKYETIIIGSDQVWRPDYVPDIKDFFLVDLPKNKYKIVSYAASFGGDSPIYTDEEIVTCGKAVSKFDGVSIREESGVDIIKKHTWVCKTSPVVVLDPTLLLTKETYNSLLPRISSPSKGKIFFYVLDQSEETDHVIEKVSEELHLSTYTIIDMKHRSEPTFSMPSMESWLSGIRDAEFVVTDSYHGTVFSIIFNKPFVVIVNLERGKDRFETLLRKVGLEKRMIDNAAQIDSVLSENIYWLEVNNRLQKEIKISMSFLNKSLET